MKTVLKYAVIILAAAIALPSALAQSEGGDIYKSKCAMCHAADGSGNTPAGKAMKTPSFDEAVKTSDADLIAITRNGKGKMPPYGAKLTGAQIKDVVAYIRTLQKK